ncbi:KTSC domain-containing protein [Mucilaginibacter sp. SMC90]|uniref:KTSC domain-containing protein n=1 Tax=Mucilaginibacter sp. SMC90 TaxID=2929803 RepID=UPI001FB33827|nr:KTSC domain-containing protein [Mucilaginibacter sp. SMC90]UOE48262.1 KTSC domain-containing protein [Mucilaginibacter sp. SMC90]
MQRRTVQSAALSSVGYDADARILELEFRENGGVWQYFGFPSSTYKKFINSDSLGHFFVTRIKGKYPELKVRFAHH